MEIRSSSDTRRFLAQGADGLRQPDLVARVAAEARDRAKRRLEQEGLLSRTRDFALTSQLIMLAMAARLYQVPWISGRFDVGLSLSLHHPGEDPEAPGELLMQSFGCQLGVSRIDLAHPVEMAGEKRIGLSGLACLSGSPTATFFSLDQAPLFQCPQFIPELEADSAPVSVVANFVFPLPSAADRSMPERTNGRPLCRCAFAAQCAGAEPFPHSGERPPRQISGAFSIDLIDRDVPAIAVSRFDFSDRWIDDVSRAAREALDLASELFSRRAEQRKPYREMRVAKRCLDLASNSADLRDSRKLALWALARTLPMYNFSLHHRPKNEDVMRLIALKGPDARPFLVGESYSGGTVGQAWRTRRLVRMNERAIRRAIDDQAANYHVIHPTTRSNLAIPIENNGRILAVLNVEANDDRTFGPGNDSAGTNRAESFPRESLDQMELKLVGQLCRRADLLAPILEKYGNAALGSPLSRLDRRRVIRDFADRWVSKLDRWSPRDRDEMLGSLLRHAIDTFKGTGVVDGSVWRVGQSPDRLDLIAAIGPGWKDFPLLSLARALPEAHRPVPELFGRRAGRGQWRWTKRDDPAAVQACDLLPPLLAEQLRSVLVIPVAFENRLEALLIAGSDKVESVDSMLESAAALWDWSIVASTLLGAARHFESDPDEEHQDFIHLIVSIVSGIRLTGRPLYRALFETLQEVIQLEEYALCQMGDPEDPRRWNRVFEQLEGGEPDRQQRVDRLGESLLQALQRNESASFEPENGGGWYAFPLKGSDHLLGAVFLKTQERIDEGRRRSLLLTWSALVGQAVSSYWSDPWKRIEPQQWVGSLRGRSTDSVLRGLVEDIEKDPALACVVSVWEPRRKELIQCLVSQLLNSRLPQDRRGVGFRRDAPALTARIFRSGKPVVIGDLRRHDAIVSDPRFQHRFFSDNRRPLAYLGLPVSDSTGTLVATLEIFRVRDDFGDPWAFTEEEQRAVVMHLESVSRYIHADVVYFDHLPGNCKRKAISVNSRSYDISWSSKDIEEILKNVENIGPMPHVVMITGEPGTGKGLIAKAIHAASGRRGAFVEVNCTAVQEGLFESEFFGHLKGAFTGAIRDKKGYFRAADTGTLLLDEIGEMPLSFQPKLLSVLEEPDVRPVGSEKTIAVDVRIIAATNSDLRERVEDGRFRTDLYDRIRQLTIHMPPVRERPVDVLPMLAYFATENTSFQGVSREALKRLQNLSWAANARGIKNFLIRAEGEAVDSPILGSDHISESTLDAPVKANGIRSRRDPDPAVVTSSEPEIRFRRRMSARYPDEDAWRAKILEALERCDGNKKRAAKSLDIDRTTLYRQMKRLGIEY